MFRKKSYKEDLAYSDDGVYEVGESVSDDGLLSRRARRKMAKAAKRQMKENRREVQLRNAKRVQTAVAIAGIATLLAATAVTMAVVVKRQRTLAEDFEVEVDVEEAEA